MTKPRALLIVIALLLSVGCRTYESISAGEIEDGDFVRILTWEGEVVKFKVLYVLPDTVVGKDEEVALRDIKSVSVGTPVNWGTRADPTIGGLAVAGLVAVAVLVGFGLLFAAAW